MAEVGRLTDYIKGEVRNFEVISIEGGKELKEYLEELDIREGVKVSFQGSLHVAEESFNLKVDDKELELCTGEASKILVENGGQSLQLSYLAPGDRGKIAGIIGGIHLEERLKEAGIGIGKEIELVSRKETSGLAKHAGCIFYLTVDNQLAVSIGRGMAEKVMVSPINQ